MADRRSGDLASQIASQLLARKQVQAAAISAQQPEQPAAPPADEPAAPQTEAPEDATGDEDRQADARQSEAEDVAAEEPTADEDEPAGESERLTFEVRGRTYQLSPDEVYDAALKGLGAESRWQEAAALREEVARERADFQAWQESQRGELEQRRARLDDALALVDFSEPDWGKIAEEHGEIEALKQKRLYEQHRSTIEQHRKLVKEEQDRKEGERFKALEDWAKKEATTFHDYVAERLKKPGLRDSDLKSAVRKEMDGLRDFGMAQGLTEQEVDAIADSRFLRLMHQAYLYSKSQEVKPGLVKKVREAPPAVAPKVAAKTPAQRRAETVAALKQQMQRKLQAGGSMQSRIKAAAEYKLAVKALDR